MAEISVIDSSIRLSEKQACLYAEAAPNRLAVGGIRSGKTWAALLFGVVEYCLKFKQCDILVIRRTSKELETGAISDFKTTINEAVYAWNDTKKIATFKNGSRLIFGSCVHGLEKEIAQYLGQAYPFILVDECAQFSPDVWEMCVSRNTVNAGCKPLADGTMPKPVIWGCTNPIGPWWVYYRSLFVEGKPFPVPEGSRKDADGRYWADERCIYDPGDYAWMHSTVLDNKPLLERDPGIIDRLNKQPEAKRKKMLLGLLDTVEGQYFECWDPEHHVIHLGEHPDAIQWLGWQKSWCGWDWGMGHANVVHWFTKALVRRPGLDEEYKLRVVCFKELVTDNEGMDNMVQRVFSSSVLPNGERVRPGAIYFSHEKFNRQMEQHSPADNLSRALMRRHFPAVTPATRDRIASAAFVYDHLVTRNLVVLDSCQKTCEAIPLLQRDPDRLDDVKKVDNVFDDVYDSFRYGLFGELGAGRKPNDELEKINKIADPFNRKLKQMQYAFDRSNLNTRPKARWEYRMRTPR